MDRAPAIPSLPPLPEFVLRFGKDFQRQFVRAALMVVVGIDRFTRDDYEITFRRRVNGGIYAVWGGYLAGQLESHARRATLVDRDRIYDLLMEYVVTLSKVGRD